MEGDPYDRARPLMTALLAGNMKGRLPQRFRLSLFADSSNRIAMISRISQLLRRTEVLYEAESYRIFNELFSSSYTFVYSLRQRFCICSDNARRIAPCQETRSLNSISQG